MGKDRVDRIETGYTCARHSSSRCFLFSLPPLFPVFTVYCFVDQAGISNIYFEGIPMRGQGRRKRGMGEEIGGREEGRGKELEE